ncbi:hypothetical protein ES703_105802 [subsurface metagenome]
MPWARNGSTYLTGSTDTTEESSRSSPRHSAVISPEKPACTSKRCRKLKSVHGSEERIASWRSAISAPSKRTDAAESQFVLAFICAGSARFTITFTCVSPASYWSIIIWASISFPELRRKSKSLAPAEVTSTNSADTQTRIRRFIFVLSVHTFTCVVVPTRKCGVRIRSPLQQLP